MSNEQNSSHASLTKLFLPSFHFAFSTNVKKLKCQRQNSLKRIHFSEKPRKKKNIA